jgi:hypothetical protein
MTCGVWADGVSLIENLGRYPAVLWDGWPMGMIVTVLDPQQPRFSLNGICPHCSRYAVFMIVAGPHIEVEGHPTRGALRRCAVAMQCQGCRQFILSIVSQPQGGGSADYVAHYPLGKPNDDVSSEIPAPIADDFKEALRCRWVDAYNATVEMCRRAVQASCVNLKAPADHLVKQIDWLAAQGIITTPLKDMAHRIRLGGNLGAHPPEDPNDASVIIIGAEYADAVIEFTRDFFQHVYVMPERLKKYTFKKVPSP